MKLYKNLSFAVVELLQQIFEGQRYADKAIEKAFKLNSRWGSRDRKFIAETTYDIVRWYRLLREVSSADEKDYWKLLGCWLVWKNIDLPAWDEFQHLDRKLIQKNFNRSHSLAIQQSVPDWLNALVSEELPQRWAAEISSLNTEAAVVLRVNHLKTNREALQSQLKEAGIETVIDERFPDALILGQRTNVFNTQLFKDGHFEVQDAGSQLIAPYLEIESGMRVIDACAGAGGKTLHLASLLKNKGRIIALDTEDWKLNELKKRAKRAGATNIETRVIESSKTIKRLHESADRLLLDVPCSGVGVLKRNPDAKWKLNPEYMDKVKMVQQKILSEYPSMLKPGGLMVYATCSILPSENENQVSQWLSQQTGHFELVKENHCWPSEGFDGFYMALIKKK